MTNQLLSQAPRLLAATIGLIGSIAWPETSEAQAAAPARLYACYVPGLGLVYRIKVPGLPQACRAASHVEFSWVAKGPMGPAGAQGEAGVAGAQGARGPRGPQGSPGSTGEPGLQGADGAPGAPGPRGLAGVEGLPGAAGDAGPTGIDGTQGDRGPAGAKGITGAQGPPGDPGSAPTGPAGVQGPPGAVGPKGFTGYTGIERRTEFGPKIVLRATTGFDIVQGVSEAHCNADETAVGGGFKNNARAFVISSRPVGTTVQGWRVVAQSGSTEGAELDVFVICVRVP